MAYLISNSVLNGSTIDILNTIRANASMNYQSHVPYVETEHDIKKVGAAIFGTPGLANEFLGELINRVALVPVRTATFYNDFAELKKGYLEFGETVEEVFVNIAKAREFSVEKAPAREFARTIPDVRAAFHVINYKAQYPITIENINLRQAFLSINGVEDMIAKIVDSIYTADRYDEYLLFKYLLIKNITKGKIKPVAFDASDAKNAAKAFRAASNMLTFIKTDYNEMGVHTATPKADQYIFMDATFNATFDVDVLSAAFNMDRAEFMGKLKLVDDWTTFDNERFEVIRANSDGLEEVTAAELALMADVKAVLVDREYIQIYDKLNEFTEVYVSSGLYWNYNYNDWKIVSTSPFSNAVVFVANTATTGTPATFTARVQTVIKGENSNPTIINLVPVDDDTLADHRVEFVQTDELTSAGVAVHKYGAIIFAGDTEIESPLAVVAQIGGDYYDGSVSIDAEGGVQPGDTVTFTKRA